MREKKQEWERKSKNEMERARIREKEQEWERKSKIERKREIGSKIKEERHIWDSKSKNERERSRMKETKYIWERKIKSEREKEELNRKGKNTLQLFWLSIPSYNLSFLKSFFSV